MEKLGLIVNTKRITRALIFLIIGLSMMFYGVIGFFYQKFNVNHTISDREIIERAKDLGMIEPRDLNE